MQAAHDETAHEGAPEWMVSYADMITIMMAFFVVMYAVSFKDQQSEEAVFNSLQLQFGRFPLSAALRPPKAVAQARGGVDAHGRHAESTSRGAATKRPEMRITKVRPGEDVVLGTNVFFEEGAAELSEPFRQQLSALAEQIGGKAQRIEVRGHTSGRSLPDGAPFRDQWDLAYARSRKVMEYLVLQGIPSRRIRLSVAGSNEPAHQGNDPLLLRENSRVQVSLLDETLADYEMERGQ